jgi:carboxymethylenebutenolidase
MEVDHNTPRALYAERAVNVIRVLSGTCVIAGFIAACHKAPPADEHIVHMASADLSAPRPTASGTQGTSGIPASANNAQARVAASPRHGEWVKIAWGARVERFAHGVDRLPVDVSHEVARRGRGARDLRAADVGARCGGSGGRRRFIAIAPDLISRVRGGPSTEELSGDSARKLIQGVSTAERNKGIAAAARYAMSLGFGRAEVCGDRLLLGWEHGLGAGGQWGSTASSGGVAYYGTPHEWAAAYRRPRWRRSRSR